MIARAETECDKYVDSTNKDGKTALMWAAHGGYQNVVRILLDADADIKGGRP